MSDLREAKTKENSMTEVPTHDIPAASYRVQWEDAMRFLDEIDVPRKQGSDSADYTLAGRIRWLKWALDFRRVKGEHDGVDRAGQRSDRGDQVG